MSPALTGPARNHTNDKTSTYSKRHDGWSTRVALTRVGLTTRWSCCIEAAFGDFFNHHGRRIAYRRTLAFQPNRLATKNQLLEWSPHEGRQITQIHLHCLCSEVGLSSSKRATSFSGVSERLHPDGDTERLVQTPLAGRRAPQADYPDRPSPLGGNAVRRSKLCLRMMDLKKDRRSGLQPPHASNESLTIFTFERSFCLSEADCPKSPSSKPTQPKTEQR